MKKVFVFVLFMFIAVFALSAKNDPFATRRFANKDTEISFRVQDSNGIPQVYYATKEAKDQYYYDFDSNYLVFYDVNDNPVKYFQYSFINDGNGLRIFDEYGRFTDLKTDNGKTSKDEVLKTIDSALGTMVIYSGTGLLLGTGIGGPAGATVGLAVGGAVGLVRFLGHDVLGWI